MSAQSGEGRAWLQWELALVSSRSSGTGASLLGTGVKDIVEVVAEKFGLLAKGFLGLVRSGSFTVLAVLGVLLKNDWMFFCPDAELAFFSVVGVEAAGVDDFLAIVEANDRCHKPDRASYKLL